MYFYLQIIFDTMNSRKKETIKMNRYDYVGSFLRPERLKKARRDFENNTINLEELKKVEDECITELITKIKELGYHTITDGEFRRSTWHLDFM